MAKNDPFPIGSGFFFAHLQTFKRGPSQMFKSGSGLTDIRHDLNVSLMFVC